MYAHANFPQIQLRQAFLVTAHFVQIFHKKKNDTSKHPESLFCRKM